MNRVLFHILLFTSILSSSLCGISVSFSQTKTSSDSVKNSSKGVDTVVAYSAADSITYSLSNRMMTLYGKGDIKYKTIELKAERIDMNWDTAILNARGVPDSADTTGKKLKGLPILIDGGEQYNGFTISYNFKTQKGKITLGETEIEKGYYHGEDIKKVESDVLFVKDGRYTTCDKSDPDYYFFSPKMKVIMNDKIIAAPIFLYIGGVPVFALPFGVFPNHGGRRSGIVTPAYGDDLRRGKYLSHLGYYWAMSDYTDLKTTFDLYTKGGWVAHSLLNYAVRYEFTGNVSANFTNTHFGEEFDPDRTEQREYNLHIFHSQQFNPTTRADIDFTFTSGNYYQNTSTNLGDLLQQNVISNATLYKTWEGTNNSFSINIYRDQNLQTGELSERLPNISFTRTQSFPFRRQQRGGGLSSSMDEFRWYELIGYNYGATFMNNRAKVKNIVSGVKTDVPGITTTQEEFERDNGQTLSQNVSVNALPKLGYFTITPSITFQDSRTYTQSSIPQLKSDSSGVEIAEVRDRRATGFFSSGISTSTRFYGIFQPNVFGISSFRHTVNPSLSFTYSKQVYEHNLSPRSMLASFSVGNLFEMKTMPSAGDTAAEGKKIQLLNLGAGISYNFAADSLKLSELGLSYRTNVSDFLSISGGSNFDFYKFDPIAHARVNKYLISNGGGLARLTSLSVNLSTSLRGGKKTSTQQVLGPVQGPLSFIEKPEYSEYSEQGQPNLNIPWDLSLAFDYSLNQSDPTRPFRSSNLSGHLDFQLTEKWKITGSASYDLINRQVIVPQITVYRDLHCWEMYFWWTPTGTYRSFKLEIRVKAPQLQDLKITKQGSARGVY
jgi:lipopolysaccharide assembly outer membrane protein LptD (OstA)